MKTGREYLQSNYKRQFDRFIATAVLRPLAVTGEAWVRAQGYEALFTQRRSGADGHPFEIYKTTTVIGERLAYRGAAFMRRLGVDETSQYRNILGGDMLLSGTRRAMTPTDEAMVLDQADGQLADIWLREVFPLPPCILSTDSLAGHINNYEFEDNAEMANRKLARDITDVRTWSPQREYSIVLGGRGYAAALLQSQLEDPKIYE